MFTIFIVSTLVYVISIILIGIKYWKKNKDYIEKSYEFDNRIKKYILRFIFTYILPELLILSLLITFFFTSFKTYIDDFIVKYIIYCILLVVLIVLKYVIYLYNHRYGQLVFMDEEIMITIVIFIIIGFFSILCGNFLFA